MKKCVTIFALAAVLFVSYAPAVHAQTAPVAPVASVPAATPTVVTPDAVVSVAEPAAPPQFAQDIIVAAQKLPVIGPFVAKGLLYLGILSSILTAAIAFLLTVLSALSGIASLANLTSFGSKLVAFRDGKIMYWLKYLSMFNAQKPTVQVAAVSAPAQETKMAA